MAQSSNQRTRRGPHQPTDLISRLIPVIAGAVIGLLISGLFAVVIMSVVFVALKAESNNSIQLLNTAMTLVGSALGAVLGYFFGRRGLK